MIHDMSDVKVNRGKVIKLMLQMHVMDETFERILSVGKHDCFGTCSFIASVTNKWRVQILPFVTKLFVDCHLISLDLV